MGIFVIVFLTFMAVIAAMAVGVMFKRKPISGSCGGLNNMAQMDDGSCQLCGAQVNEDCQSDVANYGKKSDSIEQT